MVDGMDVTNPYECNCNFSIGVPSEDIALFHALYRTSIKGRKDIISIMFSDEDDDVIQEIDASYTSRVAEIFGVVLKAMGIELEFLDDDEKVQVLNDEELRSHHIDGKVYFCTDYQAYILQRVQDIKEEILEENPIMTSSQLQEKIEEIMKTRKYINGPLHDEIGVLEETATSKE